MKPISFFALFILSLFARSQTCDLVLKGHVCDDDNHESLGFAFVKLLNDNRLIQTNEKGEFEFSGLCKGKYSILVQHVGCRDTVFEFDLTKSKKISFHLPHNLNSLQDVEVVEKRSDEKVPQSMQTLDAKQLDRVKGQSLGEQLKQMNGVTTFNTGSTISKPMINGMQGYRVLILNNGIRQEGQQWGNEHAPEIDPFIAQKLSVVRGASAVRYGSDAIGGVVLVEPNNLPDTASVTGEFNSVAYTNGRGGVASLFLEGNFDKLEGFRWRIQGTVKKSGNIKTPGYYLDNTGLEETNFSYALGYHRKKFGIDVYYSQFNSNVGIFSGAHIGNLTDLYAAFNSTKPKDSLAVFSYGIKRPYQNIEHELVKAALHIHTSQRSRVYVNYAWQYNIRQEFDKHVPKGNAQFDANKPELDYRIGTQTAEVYWEHDYIKSFRGKFGAQGLLQQNVYLGRFFIPNYVNQSYGFFAIERFVRSRIEVEAGLRWDNKDLQSYYYVGNVLQSPQLNFQNLSYNLGAIYKPLSHIKFNLNLANGWRAPAVNELYSDGLHHGVAAIERGDKNLKTEYCVNAIGGIVVDYKKFHAEATAYTYEFENYIYYNPSNQPELTIRGAFPVFNYTQNNASIRGGDALVNYQPVKFLEIKARAMWVRGRNKDLDIPLIYMPSDRYETGFALKFGDIKFLKESYIEPMFQFIDKQYRVPANADFVEAPAAYHLFGLNAGTTIQLNKQPFILTFSINNAANAVYRDYLDRFRYYNDAPGVNYTLRLRIPFVLYDKN